MWQRRALVALLIAAVAGTATGILVARLDRDGPDGPVIGLGKAESVRGAAGTLTMAFPEEWSGGSVAVNCGSAPDVHASTDDVELTSLTLRIGTGRTCTAELDPRPLPHDGAYVTAAFFELAGVECGTAVPDRQPESLEAMEVGEPPSAQLLAEFDARGAYDDYEWHHATWCVADGQGVRLEVFLGRSASAEVRERADVVVRALRFTPGPAPAPTGSP